MSRTDAQNGVDIIYNNNNNNNLLSVFPYNGSSPDKTTTTISNEIVRKL
jgi:hypothetical protein